ncbi:MAG: hypothetical protein C4524_07835 [Candidatus Zixiibacteriota bacterium]|nr:MAG: hypothetical protein C4524_07835 [candidate division Zixibacteria bacterium]
MERVDIIKALVADLESDDPRQAAAYLTEDFRLIGESPQPLDKDAFLELAKALKRGFPDWSYGLGEYMSQHGRVIRTVMSNSGTHVQEFSLPGLRPVPPTGFSIAQPPEAMEFEFRGSRICVIRVEAASGGGLMGLLEWLGVELPVCTHGLFKKKPEVEYA